MTKGTYIDLIELAVNGGVLTDENAVQRAEIEAYLPTAVNSAIAMFRNGQLDSEHDRELVNSMYQVYEDITITEGDYWRYLTLPVKLVGLPGQEAIRQIYTDSGSLINPAPEGIEDYYDFYQKHLCETPLFQVVGSKVKLYGVDDAITTVNMVAVVSAESLAQTDHLHIPAGMEDGVIKSCVEYFAAQRSGPANIKNDKRDLN